MKTIIIIVGAARSGSTLLAKAIGGHSNCFTLGEINSFNDEINNPKTHCGCAKKLSECNFWNGVLVHIENEKKIEIKGKIKSFNVRISNQLTKKNKILLLMLTILFGKVYKNKNLEREIENTFVLYQTIFNKTNSKVLIDSSKGLFRALVLASQFNKEIQFKFVQLTRDGRGVLNSSLKSSYNILHKDGVLRSYKGRIDKNPSIVINSWLYINLRNFIVLKLFNKRKSIFIRYEDFTSNPSKYLKQIYKSVDLKYEETVLNLGKNENHILSGNASRINAKKIKRQDDKWQNNLDKVILGKFNKRAGWFNKLLGYN